MPDAPDERRALARWRLVLGKFAEPQLGGCLADCQQRLAECQGYRQRDDLLDFLYGREYRARGTRGREGGLDSAGLSIPEWVQQVRELFPQETVEVLERHALDRYQLTELVTDARVLEKLEPSYELLKTVLSFRHLMQGEVLEVARRLVREVTDELKRQLAQEVRQALWGPLSRRHRSPLKVARNLDWRSTLRDNLKNFDPERRQIVLEKLHFLSRVRQHMPWRVIMAVDCSGSMMDSVIHSAVLAGIFCGLPALRVNLVLFDTRVVDVTDQIDDPTELLLNVQLGGGTTIAPALRYCEGLVEQPHRTVVALVTDFYEGGPPGELVRAVKRLVESGVRVLGLAALDSQARPSYDRPMAQACAEAGAEVACLTPRGLAEWLAGVLVL